MPKNLAEKKGEKDVVELLEKHSAAWAKHSGSTNAAAAARNRKSSAAAATPRASAPEAAPEAAVVSLFASGWVPRLTPAPADDPLLTS